MLQFAVMQNDMVRYCACIAVKVSSTKLDPHY